MKILRIDNQNACEPMKFKSKKHLRKYLIDFHLQDYHKDNKEDWKNIKLIKSFNLDQLCSHFDWQYKQITDEEAKNYDWSMDNDWGSFNNLLFNNKLRGKYESMEH